MKRAVKYCGGCNPRYDRRALAQRIGNRLGVELPSARPEEAYDEVYVLCGCSARCADVSALQAERLIVLDAPDE